MKSYLSKSVFFFVAVLFISCSDRKDGFVYQTEQFADLRIHRFQVPGFEQLPAEQKELIYYLYEASLAGRDIIYDQNYKHNLSIRRTLEAIVNNYTGDRTTEAFKQFMVYTKRVWFSNGIHHHYSTNKIIPQFSTDYFEELVRNSADATFPLQKGETLEGFIDLMKKLIFDPEIAPKRVNQDPNVDLVEASANNYYEDVKEAEVEAYYNRIIDKSDETPVSYGLNSKLIKDKGRIKERVWKIGGMYTEAIEQIVYWLEKAVTVAENGKQREALEKLVQYYRSGDLADFDEYCIAWVNDTESTVDVINGFIEVYGDPMGYRGAYESVVFFKDIEATRRIAAIGKEAQWFEDNSPIEDAHKKTNVKGITANVITVVVESGDASPSSAIGINLPNSSWIRKEHGSKSVSLGNIINSYSESSKGSGLLDEFAYSEEEKELSRKYGVLAGNLTTDMHEVIGHASGQIEPGVGTVKETLKNYASPLEEGRADLVGLYYIMDQKLVDIGVMPSLDVGRAEYDSYIRNGLMVQLARIEPGSQIEEAHMRNRQMVAKWAFEKGKEENVIEKKTRDGKTYFVINDYMQLRELFGQLLREVQRIKSQGDYEAGRALIENYGVKVDRQLHEEVLERYNELGIAPYGGFINPKLTPVMENGEIVDVLIEYPDDFTEQMLFYAREYSYLPNYN